MKAKVKFTKPTIKLINFDELIEETERLTEIILNSDEDSNAIKDNKKLVAMTRKEMNELVSQRREIKKEILEPFVEFSEKLSEIENRVNSAENQLRDKIETHENTLKQEKKQKIKELFLLRESQYAFKVSFFDFFNPSMLNKSVSMAKIENMIIDFLESVKADLETIRMLESAKEIEVEYFSNGLNINNAINSVEKRKQIAKVHDIKLDEPIKEEKEVKKAKFDDEKEIIIKVVGNEKINLLKLLLEQNKIDYEII